jgi:predicted nucleic acid-binding protein
MSSSVTRLLRVVIDTNVFVEALSRTNPYHAIYRGLLQGKFLVCLSNEVLLEYEEVLTRSQRSEVVQDFLKFLMESPFILAVSPTFRFNLIYS